MNKRRSSLSYERLETRNFLSGFTIHEVLRTAETTAKRVAAGDMDGDGDIDLVASFDENPGYWTKGYVLFRNDGNQNFTQEQIGPDRAGSVDFLLADMDQDNDLDLVSGGSTVGYHANNGSGNFQSTNWIPGSSRNGIAVGDLTGDGLPDVITSITEITDSYNLIYKASIYLHRNQGGGQFQRMLVREVGGLRSNDGIGTSVTAGDFNQDGVLDFISTVGGTNNSTFLHLVNGQGQFTSTQLNSFGASALQSGDFDKDGRLDFIARGVVTGELKVFRNLGGNNFVAGQTIASGNFFEIKTGDIDGDGLVDVTAASYISNGTSPFGWYKNLGNSSFSELNQIESIGRLVSCGLADVNRDGRLDLFNITSVFSNLKWYRNNQPQNSPPTLDPINDLFISEDSNQQTINLSGITAGASESQPLRVSANSSNPTLISSPNVTYFSPNQTGSLSFLPTANLSGTSTVTVTVEDGGLDGNLNTSGDNASFARSFQVTVNPVNDIPTLDSVSDLTINEDTPLQTANLTGITAGGGESQPLRVTASSNNTVLIPNPTVSYTSANTFGAISFVPVANQSGVATITVSVEDGGLDGNLDTTGDNATLSRVFQVTVNPVNDLPTLDALNNLTINEDATQQTINLSGITAGGGESQPLRVTASSNNTALIPNPTVSYTSANTFGAISFVPVANQSGIATFTVLVEDGGLDGNLDTSGDNATFSRTFQVTVNPVNDQPTLDALNNLTINEDATQQTINLSGITAGGGESQPLRVTASSNNTGLIPNPTVNYASANTSGSISFTPVANQAGIATITVSVEDGGLDGNLDTSGDNATFSRTFQVTVNPVNDIPTLNPLSDLALDEDAPQQTINLRGITAGEEEAQPIRVTATSSNTALIPNPTLNYVSPNPNGTLLISPTANESGIATITVSVEDGGLDGNLDTTSDNATYSRTFQVTVNPVNDAPTMTNLGGDVTYRENVIIARICNAVRIQDIDTTVFNGGSLRMAIESGSESADRLWLMNSQYLTVTGNELYFNGLVVGTFSGGASGQPLQVTFNNRASINRVQHVLRCVCFAHDSDNPSATPRTVSIQVNDGAGGQVAATKRVNVIPVNDRPMLTGIPASSTYTLNATSVLIAPNAVVTDPDNTNFSGGQLNVRYFGGQDASNRLLASGLFSFDANNNLLRNGTIVGQRNASGGIGENNLVVTFNASATKAIVQEFMRSLSFQTLGGTSKVSRYLEFSLTDGLGGTSNLVTTRIDVV